MPSACSRGFELIVSDDGGRSFARTAGSTRTAIGTISGWTGEPEVRRGGTTAGSSFSFDGGNRWLKNNNLPVSQFYHWRGRPDPYRVYGGLQDNSQAGWRERVRR